MNNDNEVEYKSLHHLMKGVVFMLCGGYRIINSRRIDKTRFAITYTKEEVS